MDTAHPLTDNLTLGANGGFETAGNTLRLSVNFDKYFDNDVMEKLGGDLSLQNTATYISGRAVDTFVPDEKWELVGGAEYNHEENYARTTLGATPRSIGIDEGSLFAQAAYKPISALDVIVGARYTENSRFGSAFSPKLSLMYSTGGWKFRGGVGTAFRSPSIKELYYDFDHQGMFWVYGNPDLKPERGVYTSLSAEYKHGSFNISTAGYYNRINNKITRYDVMGERLIMDKYYKNISHATLRGVDINVAYTVWSVLSLKGSYSFCDAVDAATGRQLDGNVEHSGIVSATWNGSVWQSPFSLRMAGRLSSPFTYYTELGGAQRSKAYSIWKVILVKPFTIAERHTVEVSFKVDNLFDFRDMSFINPGRQFMIGLHYNFNKN
jgi:outer membrane receptor for ferrienterochelin and colicins